ncbi:hypothetical protein [Curtobacterium sp. MCBA15_012]|uniref:hypothetical protein n=1 Tax=Curtobacterium sp. MCBA15_012 TaxID=1898738 RepID=UPI0008DE6B41|nr:hypothetical protein [Curtobacterium sp. MCBA15_012]WIA99715.1 hypothetical protein QOL15_14570 [Curtobacterium sp. MCBA15_012]
MEPQDRTPTKRPRRSNSSARKAGQMFERSVADYLRDELDDRIDIRPKNGRNDRGDIGGVRTPRGERVVIECKNHQTMRLGPWLNEAEQERGNDDARIGVVVHKRHRTAAPGEQFVTMTLADLVLLLDGTA